MIDLRAQTTFGEVAELDPDDVRSSLSDYWDRLRRGFADPCTRVNTLNLMVILPDPSDAVGLGALMHDLATLHPNRSLVAVLDPDGEGELSGWLSHCHSCHRPSQISSEQLVFHCPGNPDCVPSLLLPLRVPGLPTFLWWRGDPPFGSDVLERLVEVSVRVVFDSSRFSLSGSLLQMDRLIKDRYHQEQAFSDLAWGRLADIREQIASLYDGSDGPDRLGALEEVVIESSGDRPDTESLYLLGWLADRLGWRIDRPLRPEGRSWVGRIGRVSVRVVPGALERGHVKVRLSDDLVEGELVTGVDLVARELCFLNRESVFEAALDHALLLSGDKEALRRG